MKISNRLGKQAVRHILRSARAAALAVVFMAALLQPARADNLTPPTVPDNLKVQDGSKLFLVGHATGTQNYVCLPSATAASGVAFTLFTPQATLFDDRHEQIITHFFGPNLSPTPGSDPKEKGTIRVAWQFKDTSTFWGKLAQSSTDPAFVAKGAVAWLLLARAGGQNGPTGGDKLTNTTFVQRINTHGGLAPSTGCTARTDVGHQAFVPYAADYFFYH